MKVQRKSKSTPVRDGSKFPTVINKGPKSLHKVYSGTRVAVYVSFLKAVDKIVGYYSMNGNGTLKTISQEQALQYL